MTGRTERNPTPDLRGALPPVIQALYNNLDSNEMLAPVLDSAIKATAQAGWRDYRPRLLNVRRAIGLTLEQHLQPQLEHPALAGVGFPVEQESAAAGC